MARMRFNNNRIPSLSLSFPPLLSSNGSLCSPPARPEVQDLSSWTFQRRVVLSFLPYQASGRAHNRAPDVTYPPCDKASWPGLTWATLPEKLWVLTVIIWVNTSLTTTRHYSKQFMCVLSVETLAHKTGVLIIPSWQCYVNFCCSAKWFSYTYICTLFFIFFSIIVYHRILNIVPCAACRILLFLHPMYNSLHLLIPNSQSNPPPALSPLATNPKSVPYVCNSVFWHHSKNID